jgi:hypothetical protein
MDSYSMQVDAVLRKWKLYASLRRFTLRLIAVLLVCFPSAVALVFAFFSDPQDATSTAGYLFGMFLFVFFAILALTIFICGVMLYLWRCPRCRRGFNMRRRFSEAMWPPAMYGLQCSNCGTQVGDTAFLNSRTQ